jgi:hypothetical protein
MFLHQEGSAKPLHKGHDQNVHINNQDQLAADLQIGDSFDSLECFDGRDPDYRTGIRSLGDGSYLPPPGQDPRPAAGDLPAAQAGGATAPPSDKPGRERSWHPKNRAIHFYDLRQANLQAALAARNRDKTAPPSTSPTRRPASRSPSPPIISFRPRIHRVPASPPPSIKPKLHRRTSTPPATN